MTQNDEQLYDRLWTLASLTGPPQDLADIDGEAMHRMLAMGRIHGVLGIALSKVAGSRESCRATLELAGRSWRGEVVQSMRVRRHAQRVTNTLRQVGIPSTIIKGPDFADNLYADARIRPTLDVDVLVPRDRWFDAARMLAATGHNEKRGQPGLFLPSGVLSERTLEFVSPGAIIEVDLHWSLVHFPFFRKQASVDFWNLDWKWLPDSDGLGILTPASRVVIAVVHALYHHQFERLLQLVDVQAACRRIKEEVDHKSLRALIERTGAKLAFDVALQVTARFLGDPAVEDFRRLILDGLVKPGPVPEGLFQDARNNLRILRTDFMSPGRRRIREWLMKQPMRPEPGWEFRPPSQVQATPTHIGEPRSVTVSPPHLPPL